MEDRDDQALEKLIRNLQACRETGAKNLEKIVVGHLLDITKEMCSLTPEQSGFLTSFLGLDKMTDGLQRGELIIVAARPSVGKKAFALNIAIKHAKNAGSSMIFSLEIGKKQILQQMIPSVGKINGQKWRNRLFNAADYERSLRLLGKYRIGGSRLMIIYERKQQLVRRFEKGFTINQLNGIRSLSIIFN